MMRKKILFLAIIFLCQSCFGETAQEITIPGYNPATASSAPTPVSPENAAPPIPEKTQTPVPATEEELQSLIQAVDLSYWSGFASYLWTCTPRYYTMPMYNAKNDIQAAFDEFKKTQGLLTKERAIQIAAILAKPVDYKIPGLKGISCGVNIFVTNAKKPYQLTCYFLMLDARYLSQLAMAVAANSGKPEVLPADTLNAIQNLLKANCTKSDL